MKKISLFIALVLFAYSAAAQRSYSEAIQQGDAAFAKGEYKIAINKYFAAEAFDPSQKEVVKAKVNAVFDRIEKLRAEADKAKKEAQKSLNQVKTEQAKTQAALEYAEKARMEADSALAHAQQLIDAFYFYNDRIALAYQRGRFYFVDKKGVPIKKLGTWANASQFDNRGFSIVKVLKTENSTVFLLDTLGNYFLLADEIPKIREITQAIDLSSKGITGDTSIELTRHNRIEVLLLDNNRVVKFPFNANELKRLRFLSMRSNEIADLPFDLINLINLSKLFLDHNRLKLLPAELECLEQLETLSLRYNMLTHLPPEIGNLIRLTDVYLSENNLTNLPAEIGNLLNLNMLSIEKNRLVDLPDEIGNLKAIKWLNLSKNKLVRLPERFVELESLIELNLNENNLQSLPEGFGNLKELEKLGLASNELTDIPQDIGGLVNLTHLDLSRNKINNLPYEIALLKRLVVFDLQKNSISYLPPQIGQLKALVSLNLSDNKLSDIPLQIGGLKYLNRLNLANNQLNSLPQSFGELKNLIELDLTGNPLPDKEIEKIKTILPFCSIRFDYSETADRLHKLDEHKKAFFYAQKAVNKDSSSSTNWNRLSYFALYVGEYPTAIAAAHRSLFLNSKALSVERNLALAYLLSGSWLNTKAIYEKWKGKFFPGEDNKVSKDIFLQDIQELENAGVSHPDFERAKALLKSW